MYKEHHLLQAQLPSLKFYRLNFKAVNSISDIS